MSDKLNIESVCEDIISGLSYRDIAAKYGTNYTAIFKFVSDENHSARVTHARILSADIDADKAEQVLKEADSTMTEVTRAKELASHYRWKASKRNPKTYGDKIEIENKGEITVKTVTFE